MQGGHRRQKTMGEAYANKNSKDQIGALIQGMAAPDALHPTNIESVSQVQLKSDLNKRQPMTRYNKFQNKKNNSQLNAIIGGGAEDRDQSADYQSKPGGN